MAATLSTMATVAPNATLSRNNTMQVSRVAPAAASFKLGSSAFLKGSAPVALSHFAVARTERSALSVSCGGESRIGKQPVVVPSGVTITVKDQDVNVKGKLGEMSHSFPKEISVVYEDDKLVIKKTNEGRKARQLHGLSRSLAFNMVHGVSEGWEKKLELIGVGYRASLAGKQLQLNVGYSNPRMLDIPEGIQVKVEGNTKVVVSGYDKCEVGNFAAIIRKQRPPEPYKGKGVKYDGEFIMRKEGKSGK
jgi:large subunit ribosomal protein L6